MSGDIKASSAIHKDLEPGVINEEMLQKALIEQGYQGEAGRLFWLDKIDFETITTIRLEFLKILKIDHLWVMPNLIKLSLNFNKIDKIENLETLMNLRELDLSFNYIEIIENLDKLKNLEKLTLFSNRIEKLENLDKLEKLKILSVGSNRITTYKGVERFRFLKNLCSLNLEGNPIGEDTKNPIREFIAAFLPNLKYYNYTFIMPKERETARMKYFRELRELDERESIEIMERAKTAKELEDEIRLSKCFVEFLNENQLFDLLFDGDADAESLLSIGKDANYIYREFSKDFYAITQQIYEAGVAQHEARQVEIELFRKSIDDARKQEQTRAHIIVEEVNEISQVAFRKFKELLKQLKESRETVKEDEELSLPDDSEAIETFTTDFNIDLDNYWQILMETEIDLSDRIIEEIASFGHIIEDMITEFIELAQGLFVQLREVQSNFCDMLQITVTKYIAFKIASETTDTIPEKLIKCVEDRELILSLINNIRDRHSQVLDAREDTLIQNARKWSNDLITTMKNEEISKNRGRVSEINFFLDQQRDVIEKLAETYNLEMEDDNNSDD